MTQLEILLILDIIYLISLVGLTGVLRHPMIRAEGNDTLIPFIPVWNTFAFIGGLIVLLVETIKRNEKYRYYLIRSHYYNGGTNSYVIVKKRWMWLFYFPCRFPTLVWSHDENGSFYRLFKRRARFCSKNDATSATYMIFTERTESAIKKALLNNEVVYYYKEKDKHCIWSESYTELIRSLSHIVTRTTKSRIK